MNEVLKAITERYSCRDFTGEPLTKDQSDVLVKATLAAHSLGLGNVICGMMRIPLDGPKGADFKKRLKLPESHRFTIAILIGKAKSGKEPHELDMTRVTYV